MKEREKCQHMTGASYMMSGWMDGWMSKWIDELIDE
jgi:hypothetical protein